MPLVALTILAIGFIGAILNAGWSLALCFVLFPLQQLLWSSVGLFLDFRTLPNYLVGIAVVFGAIRRSARSTESLACTVNATSVGSLSLYAWAALTLMWTPSFESGSMIVNQGFPYVILIIIVMPLAAENIDVIAYFRRGLVLMGAATLLAIIVSPAFTFWSGRLVFQFSSESRTNPLALGELGGLLLLASILSPPKTMATAGLVTRAAVALVGVLAMLQSGSRGQVIGGLAIGILALPLARPVQSIPRLFGYLILGAVIVALVPIVAQLSLSDQALARWASGDLAGASEGRLANILDALSAFGGAPMAWIPGLGANAFTSVTTAASEGYVHNLTAELLVEYGVVGFGIFLMLLTYALRDIRYLFDRMKADPERRANLALLTAALAFELFIAQKQGNLWGNIMIFGLMCIIARIRRLSERELGAVNYLDRI